MKRIKERINDLIASWNKQCTSTQIILSVGFFCLINMVLSIFFDTKSIPENNIAIKSVFSSIFGYIFGKHSSTSKFGREGIQILVSGIVIFICLITLIVSNWCNYIASASSLADIRDLLLMAIGFLISKANEEKDSCL